MSDLKKIFTDSIIEHYKNNKQLITYELLQKLRSYGNEGKQIALEILDTEKTPDNYYIDAYGEKIAFLGDREIKRPFTKMKLAQIHIDELKRCAENLNYFRENYVKIRTKDGINFPEMRPYQQGFLDALTSDYETIVSLQPRQSGKSITTAIYTVWLFNFDHDKNMGICANNGGLAREFLNNVKNMFYGLPMWMRVGISVWNKSSIESENKMRILTDSPSENSFRGYTLNFLVVDETAFIRPSVFSEFMDSVMPAQSALAWKKNLFISTANGMNHFYDLVQGAKKRKTFKGLSKEEKEKIIKKNPVLETKENEDGSFDVVVDKPSNGMLYYDVSWRDVPRFNSKGEQITHEEFKEQVVDKYGLVYFNQNYACISENSEINIFDTLNNLEFSIKVKDFYDSFVWDKTKGELERAINFINKDRFQILTSEGYSNFDGIAKHLVSKTLLFTLENNKTIEVSEEHRFFINHLEYFAKDLKIGDCLEIKNGILERIIDIKIIEKESEVYDILETKNHTYYANDILNHNCEFIGSSYTLIDADILKNMIPEEPILKWDNRLDVFVEPIENHKYIMAVDPAKGGLDAFAVQILDVTSFPFEQVATAQIFKCNYQIMPEFLNEWGNRYNNAYMIIENNEGAGTFIANMMHLDFEYENLFFTKKDNGKFSKEPGFRTTTKTRTQILETFKHFVDNKRLIIRDKKTINELYSFIIKDNKYQADDGSHDDMVMSMALAFVPFISSRNFEDMKELVKKLYSDEDLKDTSFSDYLVIGNFDISVDEEESIAGKPYDSKYNYSYEYYSKVYNS